MRKLKILGSSFDCFLFVSYEDRPLIENALAIKRLRVYRPDFRSFPETCGIRSGKRLSELRLENKPELDYNLPHKIFRGSSDLLYGERPIVPGLSGR